jgi:hypothetical protein
MNRRTRQLDLDQAEAGMELACDLVDHHGTTLLQGGSILNERLLAALERRGIASLHVVDESDSPGPDEGARAAECERVQLRLAHLFRRAGGAAAAELQARLLDYRLESLR